MKTAHGDVLIYLQMLIKHFKIKTFLMPDDTYYCLAEC